MNEHHQHFDPHSLDFTNAPRYQKTVTVTARTAKPGEHMRTILANGLIETDRILNGTETIITNPTGEEYAIRTEQLHDIYTHVEEDIWQAKGIIKALPNPTGQPIYINAPWGAPQYGDERCLLAQGLNPTDRYIIAKDEFDRTYTLLD